MKRKIVGQVDTAPLFLLAVGILRRVAGEPDFLNEAVEKALTWMEYQSQSDRYLVAQQPTSEWRDEQWVTGYGLFVNTIVYRYLRLLGKNERAANFSREMGHSLAILCGLASPSRADDIINFIEEECNGMRTRGELTHRLPPNFFPFIQPSDPDWLPRYEIYNNPGEYHNGGIWPFICGLYVAALVAAKRYKLAKEKLLALTFCVKTSSSGKVSYGFNEWFKAQDGLPMGQEWQTWSAALYLYAAKCVEENETPYFNEIRKSRDELNI